MKTVTEMLKDDAEVIKAEIAELMAQHSSIYEPDYDGLVVLSPSGNYAWKELPIAGRRLQVHVLEMYGKYHDMIKVLIRPLPDRSKEEFAEADDLVIKHIEQSRGTWCRTPQEALDKTCAAVDQIQALLERLYSPDGELLFVPDTNALLKNHHIEKWAIGGVERFVLLFTPTVLGELDDLKILYRNEDVRKKAQSIIRQIKEFGRRGDLETGVPVVKEKIIARSVAMEPDMKETLPWLDAENKDDRFLASVIEQMRTNVRSVVMIVTGDVNMQNKARFARIPFCESPIAQENS